MKCEDVIKNLDNMIEYDGCKDLTAKTTWILCNLIKNNNQLEVKKIKLWITQHDFIPLIYILNLK